MFDGTDELGEPFSTANLRPFERLKDYIVSEKVNQIKTGQYIKLHCILLLFNKQLGVKCNGYLCIT